MTRTTKILVGLFWDKLGSNTSVMTSFLFLFALIGSGPIFPSYGNEGKIPKRADSDDSDEDGSPSSTRSDETAAIVLEEVRNTDSTKVFTPLVCNDALNAFGGSGSPGAAGALPQPGTGNTVEARPVVPRQVTTRHGRLNLVLVLRGCGEDRFPSQLVLMWTPTGGCHSNGGVFRKI